MRQIKSQTKRERRDLNAIRIETVLENRMAARV
jgi:hypothetical protein